MKYWYDCEFLENGTTIDLISIGIVAEDGRELYLVNGGIEWTETKGDLYDRICARRWLMANVVPHLPVSNVHQPSAAKTYPATSGTFAVDTSDNRVVPLRFIRNAVRDFLTEANGPIELWGYYGAYDHVLLCQLYGRMIDLPPGFPMWTNDVQQEAARLGLEANLPAHQGTAHNALDDARWTRDAYEYLRHYDA